MGLLDRWIKKKTAEQLSHEATSDRDEKKVSQKKEADLTNSKEKVEKSDSDKIKTEIKEKSGVLSENKKIIKKEKAVETKQVVKGKIYHKIFSPVTTEKTTFLQSGNQYVFKVHLKSTKEEVKKAIEELYGVKPLAVNILNVNGKNVRFGRMMGRRSDYKKVIVTLPQGSSIKINEAV